LIADLFRSHAALIAENAMLRQQLIVAERKIQGRVHWTPWQRFAMAIAAQLTPAWRTVTFLVQPATILRWHRAGLGAFWRRRSRRPGRPPTPGGALIREMAAKNPRWGAVAVQANHVGGHSVVRVITANHRLNPLPLHGHGQMASPKEVVADRL